MGIASLGFDSDANRIANDAKLVRGNAVYLYAALRALAAWKPAAFSVTVDGERREVSGYSVAVGNSKAYGGGMYLLPQAELDDGQLDVLITKRCSKLDVPARPAPGLQGHPSRLALRGGPARQRRRGDLRPAVRRLRRRRPDRRHPGHHAGGATLPARDRPPQADVPRGPPAGPDTPGRQPPQRPSGGTTAPGRLLLRLSPDALRRMAAELESGSVLLSATNGKTTTAAMIAAALERDGRPVVHNRAGSNMAWGVATALLDAGAEPGQLGLFEVDEAWLPRVARDVPPRLLLLANLFRDQLDRYGELELLADRWSATVAELDGRAGFVLNADDPLVADLGRERRDVTYFGLEDDSQALPGPPARRRLQALPQLRCALRLRRRLPRPPGPLPLPELRSRAPAAPGGRHPGAARGHAGLRGGAAHARGRADRPAAAPGSLQRLQRGRGRRDGTRSGRAARHGGRGPGRVRRRVRQGGDHPRRRAACCRSC